MSNETSVRQAHKTLSWQLCFDGYRYRAVGHGGLYVITYHRDDCWTAKHLHERRVRQLGVGKTLERAKALAQADYENRQ